MYIAVITRNYCGKRFQTQGSAMKDHIFESIAEGLGKLTTWLQLGDLELEFDESPKVTFVNTDTFEAHTYNIQELPKQYVFLAL